MTLTKNLCGGGTRFDAALGWANIEGYEGPGEIGEHIVINSQGLRGRAEPDPSREHVLLLGDSVAFGYGVNEGETIADELERLMPEYQVVNAAVSGYSLDQYNMVARRWLPALNPRFVVTVIFSGNDVEYSLADQGHGKQKPYFERGRNRELIARGAPISKYSCVNVIMRSWLLQSTGLYRFVYNGLCPPRKLEPSLIPEILGDIAERARTAGAQPLFLLSGFDSDTEPAARSKNHVWLRETLARGGWPYIDMGDAVHESRLHAYTLFLEDKVHLTKEGNAFYAMIIAESLRSSRTPLTATRARRR
ncbi:MAG TPA: SGNH/GDSL hydrolase family protein [Bdellovibrionales bacterium]|nr:SGNH/GDSL hydrolase family protein [Bdellovibrionales bacterium]